MDSARRSFFGVSSNKLVCITSFLDKLKQDEKDARTQLEKDLAIQKQKDKEELTRVYQEREDALQARWKELQTKYEKSEEDNRVRTKKLLDDLEQQKAQADETIKKFNQQILDKARLYHHEVPLNNLVWTPTGVNLKEPEIITTQNPRFLNLTPLDILKKAD